MIETIESHIKDFLIWEKQIIRIMSGALKERQLKRGGQILTSNSTDMHLLNNLLIFGTWDPDVIIYDLGLSKELVKFKGYGFVKCENNKVFLGKLNNGKYDKFQYRLIEKKLNKIDTIPSIVNNKQCFYKIGEYTITDDLYNWTFKSTNPKSIVKLIDSGDDRLFVVLSDESVVSLNKEDGKEIWRENRMYTRDYKGSLCESPARVFKADPLTRKLVHPLLEIDYDGNIYDPQYLKQLDKDENDHWDIRIQHPFLLSERHLIFVVDRLINRINDRDYSSENYILIVDRDTNKIVKKEMFSGPNNHQWIKKMELDDQGNLYILDVSGNLSRAEKIIESI